jgi:hypothetical protein
MSKELIVCYQNTHFDTSGQVTDVSSADLTCNAGGRSAGTAATATAAAGSTVRKAFDMRSPNFNVV